MQRNGANLREYKKTCHAVVKRADNRCEVLVDGKRCGRYIHEPRYINFLHKETRNGKSDEWILSPSSIIFGCTEHHIKEEQTGERVQGVEYEEGELTYVPDEDYA